MANKTTVDILREMREFADVDSQSIGRDVLRRKIQHFADCLEAAREREVAVAKMETTTGNNAKMREALVNFSNLARAIPVVLNDEMEVKICAALDMSAFALAAPPRNCDVYTTTDKARWAYHMEGDGIMTLQAFCDWFLSEAKGGAE